MKTEIVLFVNQKGFKEYAVRFKKHIWSKWKYSADFAGRNALYRLQDAVAAEKKLIDGENL